tara:strand:+ start:68 stop:295 length:228 start_codon:yes stop_codon:yes gene_type:complete
MSTLFSNFVFAPEGGKKVLQGLENPPSNALNRCSLYRCNFYQLITLCTKVTLIIFSPPYKSFSISIYPSQRQDFF